MPRRTTEKHTGRSSEQKAALTRTFGGLEVRDATADLRIPVTVEDVAHAERKNPERCVFAMACRRHFGSTAAVFFKTFAYVDIKGEDGVRHVERFLVNGAAQRLVAQFDREGPDGIPTDERWIILKAPPRGKTLDYNLEKNRISRQRRREALKGECVERDAPGDGQNAVSQPVGSLQSSRTPRELEIRDGTGLWHMIRTDRNGKLGKLSADDVAAIRRAREEVLAGVTKEGKPRQYAPTELVASLAERYGITAGQVKSIWRDRNVSVHGASSS